METNEEQLTRIKDKTRTREIAEIGHDYILLDSDFWFLIVQAERAQELEKEMKDIIETADVIDYRNQVMREALKFYADEQMYYGSPKWKIFSDSGDIARQALGESHEQT